ERSVLFTIAQEQGLRLTRVQPGDDGSFSVWIDDAETGALYGYFDRLVGGHAVTLERAVVSRDEGGLLSAQFSVR
ncbi:MAG: type II secretion system protein GspM, partial [Litorimonas sp.]